jgi:uncharacterized protein YbjT (DUF2867 family)
LKRVIIAGASGLIGSELLKLLLEDRNIGEVVALIRSPLPVNNSKLLQIIVDFDSLQNWKNVIYGDALYCCLGSTKMKTPDLNDYRRVDHDYPLSLAKIAEENKIPQFHLISALGADRNSKIFYSKLKGDTEADIKSLSIQSIHIYQPSLITGNRKEKRRFEKSMIWIMKLLNPILIGALKKYRSIQATTVAQTMINQTFKNLEGIHIYPSHIIQKLA